MPHSKSKPGTIYHGEIMPLEQTILSSQDPLPALGILTTAEIPREDKRPAHGNLLDQEPFKSLVLGDPFKPFQI